MVKSGFIRLMIRRTVSLFFCYMESQNLSVSNDDPAVKKTDSYVCRVGGSGLFSLFKN